MNLSQVYDDILADPEATQQIYAEIKPFLNSPILECACGSGDLLLHLQKEFQAFGLDLDKQMLELAAQKGCINLICGDMLDLSSLNKNNTILCLGDSLNYLLDKETIQQFFEQVYLNLNAGGTFIFDMHSMHRLEEFLDPFIEEANMGHYQYQWTIVTQDDYLAHQFVFFIQDETMIQTINQRVYQPGFIRELLSEIGFTQIIEAEDENKEKVLFRCMKEESK